MPRKPDPRQMSLEFDVKELDDDFEEDVIVVTPEMIAQGSVAIEAFDAAVRAGDFDA
jgi:hypothetical protein